MEGEGKRGERGEMERMYRGGKRLREGVRLREGELASGATERGCGKDSRLSNLVSRERPQTISVSLSPGPPFDNRLSNKNSKREMAPA